MATEKKKKEKIHFQLHPKQAEVFKNDARFRVVVAGRRWGKSKLSMMTMLSWATKKGQKIWYVAPTYKMAKQIMWNELKMWVPRQWVTKIRENELSMELRNGSRIDLKGADKPDSLRGVSLDFLVLDEFQDISPETWKTVLRPTLADRKGHALFIGTPKGFNMLYEVYRLGQKKEKQMKKQWMSWQFPTITSPFIPNAEIEAARRDMDEKSFRQEFCHRPTTEVMLWGGGVKAIKDLNIGDELVYVGPFAERKKCRVTDVRKTGNQPMMRVTFFNGETFTASRTHKVKYADQKVSLCDARFMERWVNGGFQDLYIVKREELPPEPCMNITVDSPDHSYLLADGTNNFNCASFESMSGRVYYAFDRKDHVANVEFNPKLPIWVGMDFNIDPMSTVIFQPQPNGQIWAVDEIVQVASNTDDICAELEKRYYKYQNQVTIYPDPAGSARQHARGESDLDIIREHGFKRIKVKRAHSAIADRVNAVNRVLRTASGDIRLFINPKCKHLIDSFEQTLYIAGTRDVDKSLGVEHSADAAGYCIEIEFPLRKFAPAGFSR